MIKMTRCVALSLTFSTGFALAQAPAGAPAPGPEHARLGYFVGTWSSKGEVKPNPFMPAGTMTSNDSCAWFEGNFAVVCNYTGTGPMGPTKGLGIMGYSTEEKVYTYFGLDSGPMTMTTVPKGKVQGGSWVYTDESMMGGKMLKSRYSMTEISPTAYSFKWEMMGEKGWETIIEGKSTKK